MFPIILSASSQQCEKSCERVRKEDRKNISHSRSTLGAEPDPQDLRSQVHKEIYE